MVGRGARGIEAFLLWLITSVFKPVSNSDPPKAHTLKGGNMTAIEMVVAERVRQQIQEGYLHEHDDI